MKPFRVAGWVCALGLWLTDGGMLQAAWCNVFQVCCGSCRTRSSASYYVAPVAPAAAPAACCPQPQCTTRYSLRCYYQPVTAYQSKSYYEKVTTYRTSYYYEPVTSYRYSCYYDPCSCSYQQVAVPQTSYSLKQQCCPVESWVQRCCSVPVTTYQKSYYWAPQTTCCAPVDPCAAAGPPATTYSAEPPANGAPARPPQTREEREAPRGTERYYGSGFRQPAIPQGTQPAAPVQPAMRLDRVTSMPITKLEGTVVRSDNAPRARAQVQFVSASRVGPRYPVTANSAGRFRVTLTSGSWLVYITTPDGREVYHSRLDLNGDGTRRVTLVSR